MNMNMNILWLEFLGTAILMFMILYTSYNPIIVGGTFTFLILMSMSLGITGVAFNPAIAFGKVALNHNPAESLIPVILCEVLGALTGAELYKRVR
jgi:glycerol uptake facilitator-like aquaporin